jgi:hypothetical protein
MMTSCENDARRSVPTVALALIFTHPENRYFAPQIRSGNEIPDHRPFSTKKRLLLTIIVTDVSGSKEELLPYLHRVSVGTGLASVEIYDENND